MINNGLEDSGDVIIANKKGIPWDRACFYKKMSRRAGFAEMKEDGSSLGRPTGLTHISPMTRPCGTDFQKETGSESEKEEQVPEWRESTLAMMKNMAKKSLEGPIQGFLPRRYAATRVRVAIALFETKME